MRLLLLNINYLQHHFYQNHTEKIMDFAPYPLEVNPCNMLLFSKREKTG